MCDFYRMLEMLCAAIDGREPKHGASGETNQLGDVAVALKFVAGVLAGLGLCRRVTDLLGATQDGTIKRKDSLPLEELSQPR